MSQGSGKIHSQFNIILAMNIGNSRSWGFVPKILLFLVALIGCSPQPTLMNSVQDPSPTRTQIVLPTALIPTQTPFPIVEPTLLPSCEHLTGSLESINYPGVVGPEEIRVLIHLPPCYEIDENEYPILYLLHGYPLDENHWMDLGIVKLIEVEREHRWGSRFL
jgi:hypothetical protein